MRFFIPVVCVVTAVSAAGLLYAQSSQTRTISTSTHSPARKYSYALVNGDSITCTGQWEGSELKALREKSKELVLYVRKDGTMYVISDKATVTAAKDAMKPVDELGKQQGALGHQQGMLGKEQGELGRKQGELGRQQGMLARELATQAASGEGIEQKISEQMKALGERQKAIGKEQEALGKKQSELGKKQSELGKRQGEAWKIADEKITGLIDGAFAKGLAIRS